MNDFMFWLKMGIDHIIAWDALDHLLFITALCGIYTFSEWKKVIILVTAFTIGHSLTLALCSLGWLKINTPLVEFLIPFSIVITTCINFFSLSKSSSIKYKYIAALIFGLIHGMGFSNVLKSLLNKSENVIFPLFSFNIGIEIGQIIVVLLLLLFSLALYTVLKFKTAYYTIGISILVLIPAIIITINRFIELVN